MSEFSSDNKKDTLASWIPILILLAVFPPVGVVLLVLKVLELSKPGRGRAARQESAPAGARTAAAVGAAPKAAGKKRDTAGPQSILARMARSGKRLIALGGILTVLFTLVSVSMLGDDLYWLFHGDAAFFLQELLRHTAPSLCLAGAGAACLWSGLKRRRIVRRCRTYLAMLGQQKTVSVSALAAAANRSPAQVRKDLAEMLDAGLFPQGFLDYGGDRLVLSGEGLQHAPPPSAREAAPVPPQDTENAVLSEIREVNDAIGNEKLSAQIDRIGVITARILDYQRSHPEKAPQLHSFLSYYLPTTLKILRAYARLEAQEVSGENISASMQRIEGMMDKVVEGFEKQLDLLFQGDAMDIAADVDVLERMLAKDGLSDSQGLTLGA